MTSTVKRYVIIVFSLFFMFSITYALKKSNDIAADTAFRYTGPSDDYSELIKESNWEIAGSSPSCNPGNSLPCIVEPEMGTITPTDLVNHLKSYTNPDDAEDFVANQTTEKRD